MLETVRTGTLKNLLEASVATGTAKAGKKARQRRTSPGSVS